MHDSPSSLLLTGVNYLPQVGMIEDFSPYWIMDRWSTERMEDDFRIMSALGMSMVRFHISPYDPNSVVYPGLAPGKYLEMLDQAVEFQRRYGLQILLDIGAEFADLTEDVVRLYVERYRGRIAYYQLGNEQYHLLTEKDNFLKLCRLIAYGRSIDPSARFSADLMTEDLYRYRDECPAAFNELDFHTIHFYCPVDYRGWDDASLDVYTRYCSGNGEAVEYPEGYHKITVCRGKSFGGLKRERWVTEVCGQGYFRWGNVTPSEVWAESWRRVMAASRTPNGPSRVCHHCFRDKMSWREFGLGQSGIVCLDGAPKPVAWVFREESLKGLPDSDLRKHLRLAVEPVNDGQDQARIVVQNRLPETIHGHLRLCIGNSAGAPTPVTIPCNRDLTAELPLDDLIIAKGRQNLFVRLEVTQGTVWAYNTLARSQRIVMERLAPFPSVVYPDDMDAIEEFLNTWGKDLPIITGPFIGEECEMGYRLKCALDHLLGGDSRVYGSMNCEPATRRPFALVTTMEFNPLGQLIEGALPAERRPEALLKSHAGFVQMVHEPFGSDRNGWSQLRMGIRHPQQVPAALYIGGRDFDGLRAATYDLIRRFWPHTIGQKILQATGKDMLDA